MSGELTLDSGGWWKNRLLAAVLTAAATLLIDLPVIRLLASRGVEGIAMQASSGVLTLALCWALYSMFSQYLPKAADTRTVTWVLTADTLTLGTDAIARDTIRMVHCWKKENGWTVNIETTGRNRLLRSLSAGEDAKRSALQLRALVIALGYQAQWKEE